MREVDRLMVEKYGILLIQMMENAGRGLAQLARCRFLAGDPRDRRVLVLAGTGGNGGGGLVCARRLHDWGAEVRVRTTAPADRFTEVSRHQLAILERLNVPLDVVDNEEETPADLIAAALIRGANSHPAPVLALDVPSGLDATTGAVHEPAIRATATLTLALPKTGLHAHPARDFVGELYLGDIGVPASLYAGAPLALDVGALFAKDDIVRLF